MSIALWVLAFGLPLFWSSVSFAVIGYQNPFCPEQCKLALGKAQRLRHAGSNDLRARLVRAEALLCRGVQDDPAALDLAITGFERVVEQEPLNFFARLYLAEAVRHKFAFSDDAVGAFLTAQRVLNQADVGAARAGLETYISQTLQELREQRDHFASVIRDGEAALDEGTASPHEVGQLLQLIALTGPEGRSRALGTLDAYVAAHHDRVLDTFYRAELLRGQVSKSTLGYLYDAATGYVCHSDLLPDQQACFLVHKRLKELDAHEVNVGMEQSGNAAR